MRIVGLILWLLGWGLGFTKQTFVIILVVISTHINIRKFLNQLQAIDPKNKYEPGNILEGKGFTKSKQIIC